MHSRTNWLRGSLVWIVAGLVFPLLTPATNLLSRGLQRYLSSGAGMSDELAQRVAFTILRIPLTAVLATLVAAFQCALLPGIRPRSRWIVAAAVGACIATLIFLPSNLVALSITGNISEGMIRVFLLAVPGAGLLAGLVCFLQRWVVRRQVLVPASFVVASGLAAVFGVLGELLLE